MRTLVEAKSREAVINEVEGKFETGTLHVARFILNLSNLRL